MTGTADRTGLRGHRGRRDPGSRARVARLEEALPRRDREGHGGGVPLEIRSRMQIPGLVKIVVNMGVGEAAKDSKVIDGAIKDYDGHHRSEAPGHQGPEVDRAVCCAKACRIGCHVTLRGDGMWNSPTVS